MSSRGNPLSERHNQSLVPIRIERLGQAAVAFFPSRTSAGLKGFFASPVRTSPDSSQRGCIQGRLRCALMTVNKLRGELGALVADVGNCDDLPEGDHLCRHDG